MELKRKVCLGVRFHCVLSLTELPFQYQFSITGTVWHSSTPVALLVQRFLWWVCACVCLCACMAGGSFPKQQQTWRQKLCRVLLCICVVVFFCNAGIHFVYFSKKRKKETKPKQTSKPLQEVRFKALSKKKKSDVVCYPDWITHHITVVALYVCVHACVWRRRGGRNRAWKYRGSRTGRMMNSKRGTERVVMRLKSQVADEGSQIHKEKKKWDFPWTLVLTYFFAGILSSSFIAHS